jgi:hypothetical protein
VFQCWKSIRPSIDECADRKWRGFSSANGGRYRETVQVGRYVSIQISFQDISISGIHLL